MGGYDQQLFRISKLLSVCVYVLPGPVKRLHIHRLNKNRLKMCIHVYNCRWRGDDDDVLHRPGCVALLLLLNPKKMPQFHEPVARASIATDQGHVCLDVSNSMDGCSKHRPVKWNFPVAQESE